MDETMQEEMKELKLNLDRIEIYIDGKYGKQKNG